MDLNNLPSRTKTCKTIQRLFLNLQKLFNKEAGEFQEGSIIKYTFLKLLDVKLYLHTTPLTTPHSFLYQFHIRSLL